MKVMFSIHDDINDCTAPKTLCDWVKNFRIKKLQMKRKLRSGGDLRMCAIMTNVLRSAENELRQKQQERLNRFLQLQSKFHKKTTSNLSSTSTTTTTTSTKNIHNYYRESSMIVEAEDEVEEKHQKQRIEICNLWRDELNSLDEFMRKMSSNSNNCISSININSSNIKNSTCGKFVYTNDSNNMRQSIAVSS